MDGGREEKRTGETRGEKSMRMTQPTSIKDIKRDWHFFNVRGKTLGRVATEIAQKLIGKSKPYFVPHLDCGDYTVVVNAVQVSVSGKKSEQKEYQRFSGYPSGLKRKTFAEVLKKDPTRIIREAVSGMLPKNKLRASMLKRLYIFPDDKHPYQEKFNVTQQYAEQR